MGPAAVLARHGETEWTKSGQHTGRTDIPLTGNGERQATGLATALAGRMFALVLTSPRQRARETCRLAGFGDVAEESDDVVEWDYGAYEGRTTPEIRVEVPSWSLWQHGSPGGETADDVATRADRVVERVRQAPGDVLVFSHGHFLRVLTARWIGLPAASGERFALAPASVSVLGWERQTPVLTGWNHVVV